MNNFKKHLLILSLFFLIFSGLLWQNFAQGRGLEVPDFPDLPGIERPTDIRIPLPLYFRYIYTLSIFLAGVLTFVLFIWGGVKYIFSAGNPSSMLDARDQITNALLGLVLIFSSYLILRTINPQLVMFPRLETRTIHPIPIGMVGGFDFSASFEEIPLGTLITSEYTLSSFIATTTPDLSFDDPDYATAFISTSRAYPTYFQGALHGNRLKRIHEVASTTLPIIDMLVTLSSEYVEKTRELKNDVRKLQQYAQQCSCINCYCLGCFLPSAGTCPGHCEAISCSGDPCGLINRTAMENLKNSIPDHYTNPDDPLPCKEAEIEYMMEAYRAFLDGRKLKNPDYQNRAWWYSDDAKALRQKIEACIAAGESEQKRLEKIEDLIDMMAEVENKGSRGPMTEFPTRDLSTNLSQIRQIYETLLDVKRKLNPYDQAVGFFELLSWHGLIRFQAETQIKDKKTPFIGRPTPAGPRGRLTTHPLRLFGKDVVTTEDPVTLYAMKGFLEEFLPQKNQEKKPFSFIETAFATSILPEPMETKAYCARMVEIPIGKALDEALKLIRDIVRELDNIMDRSKEIMDDLKSGSVWSEEDKGQVELVENMGDLSEELIDLVDECKMCGDVPCHPTCVNIWPYPPGYMCISPCQGDHPCPIGDITGKWSDFQGRFRAMEQRLETIKDAQESINESFKKLDSQEPMNEDNCCINNLGNCRDNRQNLKMDEIEEREYTLKDKLIEVQKLLNRSRQTMNLNRQINQGKSVYELLIEQLIPLGLADEREIRRLLADEKLDLTNCDIVLSETAEIYEQKETRKALMNCKVAGGEMLDYMASAIKRDDREVCSPDPLLDCDYFNPSSQRRRRPFPCYCYDEDIRQKRYPAHFNIPPTDNLGNNNLSNNLFCCVLAYK